jgi:IS1 family transposase
MARILPKGKQLLVLRLLTEGNSIRSTVRITGIHKKTVTRLLVRVGNGCRKFLNREMRGLKLDSIECDEIWTFCRKKQGKLTDAERNDLTIGDQYLYIAQDKDSLLIPSYALGKRNEEMTRAFMDDLSQRIIVPANPNAPWDEKPQISTDGWQSYPGAVEESFGSRVNYGQIIKSYENHEQPGRYGPPDVVKSDRRRIRGVHDLWTICTSHVERNNLTIRTFMKRFTRLALGFSKKQENLWAAISLHVAHFNYCWRPRVNGKSGRYRLTPAMQAGVVDRLWKMEDLYDAVTG